MKQHGQHLFGPVPSRRLGRSLGVDLTPFKTCTLDCIFCQLGRTTHRTLDRRNYVSAHEVEAELAAWINGGGKADYITLAGSGEPTLNTRFGDILQFVRDRTDIPTALLSNGTLFWLPGVREAARRAALVKLSLSAWDQASFAQINRPCPGLEFQQVMDGYRAFRAEFGGTLWIEVFLVRGTNSLQEDVARIAALVDSIGADEVHLNTAVRPPAEDFALAVPRKQIEALADLFHPAATVVAEFSVQRSADIEANEGTILAMLRRRPCTAQQMADVFGMHPNEVSKYVGKLLRTHKIAVGRTGEEVYYTATGLAAKAHAET